MGIHIGNEIKKVLDDKRMERKELAKRIGMHTGSVSRVLGYDKVSTGLLEKISVALEHDFFSHYSVALKLGGKEGEKTACEKQVEELMKENERLRGDVGYLREINELLKKR